MPLARPAGVPYDVPRQDSVMESPAEEEVARRLRPTDQAEVCACVCACVCLCV